MKFDLEKLIAQSQQKSNGEDDFPEEKKRFTDDKRTEARLLAIQAVFTQLNSEKSIPAVINESLTYFGLKSAHLDKKLFVKIAKKALEDKENIIKEIECNLEETWNIGRLDSVSISILIAATAELLLKETAVEILISEYMALSNAFVNKDQVSFIHGVLSSIIKKYKLGE